MYQRKVSSHKQWHIWSWKYHGDSAAQELYRGCSTGWGQVSASRGWIDDTLFAIRLLPLAWPKWLSAAGSIRSSISLRRQQPKADVYRWVIQISKTLKTLSSMTNRDWIGEASWLGEDQVALTSFSQSSSVYAPLYTRHSTTSSPWPWHLHLQLIQKKKKELSLLHQWVFPTFKKQQWWHWYEAYLKTRW